MNTEDKIKFVAEKFGGIISIESDPYGKWVLVHYDDLDSISPSILSLRAAYILPAVVVRWDFMGWLLPQMQRRRDWPEFIAVAHKATPHKMHEEYKWVDKLMKPLPFLDACYEWLSRGPK